MAVRDQAYELPSEGLGPASACNNAKHDAWPMAEVVRRLVIAVWRSLRSLPHRAAGLPSRSQKESRKKTITARFSRKSAQFTRHAPETTAGAPRHNAPEARTEISLKTR